MGNSTGVPTSLAELCAEAWGWPLEVAEANVAAYRSGLPLPEPLGSWVTWRRVDAVAGAPGVRTTLNHYVSNKCAFRRWCIDARREFVAIGDALNREVRYG